MCDRVHNNNGDNTLFSFLKKRVHINGKAGIELREDGISLARSAPAIDGQPPRLTLCRFTPYDTGEEPAALLQKLSKEQTLEATHCISIAPQASFSLLLVESPEVDASELKAAVRWRIKELIDFHIDDAIIDVFDIPGQKERGRAKLMYVVASRTSTVQQHIDLLESNGLNLAVIDIPELVLRNIAALLPEDKSGVATLYIGRNHGMLTITRDRTLYLSRRIDLGLTQLIERLNTPPAEDEFVLDEQEPPMPPPLKSALDNIVLEIQRSLDYYESHFSLPPVGGLVMAPMEENIPGMMGYLGGSLGVPVRMLDLNALVECDETLTDQLQSQCLFAIGAALREETRAL
jgi:MSHA biogenesis protein MshI